MDKYVLMRQAWTLYLRVVIRMAGKDLLSPEAARLRRVEKAAGKRYDRRLQAYQAE